MAPATPIASNSLVTVTVKNPLFARVQDGSLVVKQVFGLFAEQRATKWAKDYNAR